MNNMKIDEIIQYRANRKERSARPWSNFHHHYEECINAGGLIIEKSIKNDLAPLISRAVIITTVSAIEVYYKDILDFIFRYCKPNFFKPHLKKLLPDKYDVSDIINFHENNINPYELISSSQSFQNIEKINKVFSLFLAKDLWSTLLECKYAFAQKKELITEDNTFTWSQEDINGMKRIFDLRHQIVHDLVKNFKIKSNHMNDLSRSMYVVLGSDLILSSAIEKNKR